MTELEHAITHIKIRADAWAVKEVTEALQSISERLDKALSQEQKSRKWIPVSERLPEDSQYVLFCDIDSDIMVGYHVQGRPNTHFSQDGTWEDIKNVKAWMPLPEPYRGEVE